MAKIKLMPTGVEGMPPMSCVIFDDDDKEIALIPYSVYELQPSSNNDDGLVMHLYVTKKRGGTQKVAMIVGIGATTQAYTVNADGGLSELMFKDKTKD